MGTFVSINGRINRRVWETLRKVTAPGKSGFVTLRVSNNGRDDILADVRISGCGRGGTMSVDVRDRSLVREGTGFSNSRSFSRRRLDGTLDKIEEGITRSIRMAYGNGAQWRLIGIA